MFLWSFRLCHWKLPFHNFCPFLSWIVFLLICECSLYIEDTHHLSVILFLSSLSLFFIACWSKSKILNVASADMGGLASVSPMVLLLNTVPPVPVLAHIPHPFEFLFILFPLFGIHLPILCLANIDHSFTPGLLGRSTPFLMPLPCACNLLIPTREDSPASLLLAITAPRKKTASDGFSHPHAWLW